jgi:hypothetical protein
MIENESGRCAGAKTLQAIERKHILRALEEANWVLRRRNRASGWPGQRSSTRCESQALLAPPLTVIMSN